jgi:hypothetical protein
MSALESDVALPGPGRLWSLWEMLKIETTGVLFAYSYIGAAIKTFQIGRTEMLSAGHLSMNVEANNYMH